MERAGLDWFLPAVQGQGSWLSGLERLICVEESKLQFARSLKFNLCNPVPHAPDRIAVLQQDIKTLDQTLQLRLGMLAADRPQAWFRHSPPTERGPFPATIYEDPIFTRFDEGRASAIRLLLPELWKARQLSCTEYDSGFSLWGRLLGLNQRWGRLNQLPAPFSDVFVDELPEALPDEIYSPSLFEFAGQLSARMRQAQKDLEACYQKLWGRSETFLYALHIQHLSQKAKQQEQQAGKGDRQANRERPKWSHAIEEALRFMAFSGMPNFNELRLRYRQLAQELHPDRGGNIERFQILTEHYQRLLGVLPRS